MTGTSETPREYDVTAEIERDGDTSEIGIHLAIEDKAVADQLCADLNSKILGATIVSALPIGKDAALKFQAGDAYHHFPIHQNVKTDGMELALAMLGDYVGGKVVRVFVEDVTDWNYEEEDEEG